MRLGFISISVLSRLAGASCLAAALALGGAPARAQEIVASVNGDPITSYDIEQRLKLLRGLRKGGGRDAAIESLVSDRLRAREASRFGINIGDDEIGAQIQEDARQAKMSYAQMMEGVSHSGASAEHVRNHFKSELAFVVLVKALNRGVEASESAVRGELAKEKGKSGVTNYTMRQVVFTLSPSDGPAQVEAALKQAQALRSRFTSCDSGLAYAKSLPGVAVRAKLVRDSTQLNEQIKDVLDKTPIGHLTEPSRSGNGFELIAVCARGAPTDDDQLRKQIGERLLDAHIRQIADQKYRELRRTAVIDRRGG